MMRRMVIWMLPLALVCCDRGQPVPETVPDVQAERRAAQTAFWTAYRAGLKLARENQLVPSRDSLGAALILDPVHEGALYQYGNVSFELGQYSDAAGAWKKLVTEHPHSARGFAQLGMLYSCGQDSTPFDLARAEGYFEGMYAVNKESSEATIKLGEVALLRGRLPEAIEHFDKAIAFDVRNRTPRVLKGLALWMAGDSSGAVASADEGVEKAAEKPRPFASEEGDTRSGSQPMLAKASRTRSLLKRTIDRIVSGEPASGVFADTELRVNRVLSLNRERDEDR